MKEYFKEIEFTSLFFALLYKEGITKVEEKEILKKLYYYYRLPDFKCLFYDIGLLFGFDKVDLNKSLAIEKEIKNIAYDGNYLNLDYRNYDYKNFLTRKNVECLTEMSRLVKQFALRLKIEQENKYPINIYYKDANGHYNIFQGKKQKQNVYWQLITNGTTHFDKKIKFLMNYAENPLNDNDKIILSDIFGYTVNVCDANYTILKGMNDDEIGRIKVFTQINNEEQLKKICEYANDEEILLHRDKEAVRRLHL